MGLAIRRAWPTEDRQEILGLFERNFGDRYERRFNYLFSNPAGQCWTWLVYDQSSKAVLGTTSLFSKPMYVNGNPLAAGQVMFFAVDAKNRSLGPAVMLQRATFEPVDRGELAFCYDCPPHDQGMSTFVRLGMRPNCEMIRYVLPLRSDEYVRKRFGRGIWTKPLVSTANLLLGVRRSYHGEPGIEISRLDGAFGDEFSYLDRLVSSAGVIRAQRSADFLNWRFREFPGHPRGLTENTTGPAEVLVARRQGELLAFAVFTSQDDDFIAIADLFGLQLAEVGRSLLEAVIEIGRRNNSLGVYAYLAEGSELSRIFRSAGFRPRERCARVVAYEKSNGRTFEHLNTGLRWAFSQVELMQ